MLSNYPEIIKLLPKQIGKVDTSSKFKLEANDCKVLFASYQPGTSIPKHKHIDSDIVGVVTKGQITLTIEGVTSKYSVGEWYHIPPGAEHETMFEQDTDEIEFWFNVKP